MENKVIELNNKGVQLFMAGKLSEAEAIYEQALEINADHATTLNNMGMLKLQQKEFSSALSWFDKALSENEKPVYYLNKGHAYANLKKLDEAVKNYNKCLKLDPQHEMAWVSLAKLYTATGNFQQSVRCWRKVIQLNERAEYLVDLAKTLINTGDLNAAQSVLFRAAEYNENPDVISYYLALIAFHQKNFGLAVTEVKRSLAEKPDNASYRQLLAVTHLSSGNFKSAVEEWNKILKLEPENINARTDLAVALLGNRYFDEAEKQLELVLRQNPSEPKAQYYKAVLLNETSKPGAMDILEKLAAQSSPFAEKAKALIQKLKNRNNGGE